MQGRVLNLFRLAGCVHEEWQDPARNHNDSIQNVDRSNAQQVSQAGQEHGGGLRDQRSAYDARQDRIACALRRPVSGAVIEGVQKLRGDETAEGDRPCLWRGVAIAKGSVEPGRKRAGRNHASLGAEPADMVARQNAFVRLFRRLSHHIRVWRLQGQADGRQHV